MNSKNDSKLTVINIHTQNKNKSKQLEQEQNHRNGDHMEEYQWGGEEGRIGESVQGTNSDAKETGTHINGVDQK